MFGRIADLQPGRLVTIYVDSENLKIGFDFHGEKTANSFLLTQNTGRQNSFSCAGQGLLQKYPWIQSVSRLGTRNRRFTPSKEGKLWVIQLCPAFEERRARESADNIPSEVPGVYRYVRESGEIVYIGRAEVKKRLSQPERRNWDFDRIEYSVLSDPDQQVKWEDYWITRFKESNKGRLPIYNKISGASSDNDGEAEDR
jgi:hypothetical protein